jgi:hypothetical protein
VALTNTERQTRWREKHIVRRRTAQRIVNLLVRQSMTDEHVEQLAGLLATFFTREGNRILRRKLRQNEDKAARGDALWKQHLRTLKEQWLAEHPGCNAEDYDKLDDDMWSRLEAAVATEKEAWERDHPGEEYPMYADGINCGLSGREQTDMARWRRDRARRRARAK